MRTVSLRKQLDTEPARKPRPAHKPGYEVEATGSTVSIGTALPKPPQADTWRKLLEAEGYDPDAYHVNEETGVHHRKWQQTEGGDFLHYFRFTAVRNDAKGWDVSKLIKAVGKRKARAVKEHTPGAALVVCLADWQVGADHGGGPEPLMERIRHLGPAVTQRWKDLRKVGVDLTTLYVHSMGDMGEGCDGHYAQQTYTIQLDGEEQREFVIHAADMLLEQWALFAPRIAVYAVPGNHGENRKGGKSFTTFRDNVDTGVWVNLAHAYSKNPERYGHVQFHTPTGNDLSMTYDHDGFITALAHGHQAFGGGDPAKKMDTWWRGQMAGMQPAGDADLLVTGHWHHARLAQQGARTHFMAPALCGSQSWWTNAAGLDSPPGTLTYTISSAGWDNVKIIEPGR